MIYNHLCQITKIVCQSDYFSFSNFSTRDFVSFIFLFFSEYFVLLLFLARIPDFLFQFPKVVPCFFHNMEEAKQTCSN